ncbi:MAG: RNA 2',3'-cyclic phosphodiesterase [Armatimonadota bacterium]
MRTFIAVPLPAEVRREVAGIERALTASEADVRWVSEENLHITLKFLGDVERTDAVAKAVRSAVAGFPPFRAALAGVGAFPKPSRPSVIWVGVSEGKAALAELAERVEAAMESLGFAREIRPFSPHVTVGRVRTSKNLERLREIIERMHGEAGSFEVRQVAVMRSDLSRSGPTYTPIAEAPLST